MEREELLRPVLAGHQRTGYKPWRLQSQIYVGFFGGALAVGAIAFAIGSGEFAGRQRDRTTSSLARIGTRPRIGSPCLGILPLLK